MARITARQAFVKAKAKRKGKTSKRNDEIDPQSIEPAQVVVRARQKYMQKLSELTTMASDQTPRRVSARAKAIAQNNRKITDYYQVITNAGENFYQQVTVNARKTTRANSVEDGNNREQDEEDVEVVAILPPISLRSHPIFDVEDD